MRWSVVVVKFESTLELLVGAYPVVIKELEKIR
jgi:hypothetical protein